MQPSELKAEQFEGYPPLGRQFAIGNLALLRRLPQALVPSLLAEVIVYDWKFPAERKDLEDHFNYLSGLSEGDLHRVTIGFARLRLSSRLEKTDWAHFPGEYVEALSAELWVNREMDAFRAASGELESRVRAWMPKASPSLPRLSMVVIGRDVGQNSYPLFRKLRSKGTYFTNVTYENGLEDLFGKLSSRAARQPLPYAHWYIEGGDKPIWARQEGITTVCYGSLEGPRESLLRKMQDAINSGTMGPEALRTMLARMSPADIGLDASEDAILNHFQVSVLTEGSGTQIFSTTFSQWAAREVLRRAQPLTLLIRFSPRQGQRDLNELLAKRHKDAVLDVAASLIDADMGAYYTWIGQQRLTGADSASFLVWFEDHNKALVIDPGIAAGMESSRSVSLRDLVHSVGGSE